MSSVPGSSLVDLRSDTLTRRARGAGGRDVRPRGGPVHAHLERSDAATFVAAAAEQGVRVATVGQTAVLDVSKTDAEAAAAVLRTIA